MRNTDIYSSNGLHGMNINSISVDTNTNAINADHIHRNECQPMGFPVATKSQPKPKSKCIESSSNRPTKRPPSERRFKCDQCERMFFTRKDVKRHLVVHTGIRNFACPYCTQRFGRKDHLVRHAKKSHNRDTRSSSSVKTTSVAHTSDKMPSNGLPTLIEAKNNSVPPVPMVPVMSQQLSHNNNKQGFNYQTNCQNSDHSALVLLANTSNNITSINNSHNEPNGDNQCSNYSNHSNPTSNHTNHVMIAGMHANESLCQYMTGVHTFDEMMASNAIKNETPSPLAAHHYFAFPVNSSGLTYPLPNPPFLPNCLVANSNPGLSSCASSASVAAFGIPVSNVSSVSAPIHTTFSVDMNPSLPHFNQAFQ